MEYFVKAFKLGLSLLIYGYRYTISYFTPAKCRFYPSCSEYALGAIKHYSLVKASLLIMRRLLKCHPLHPGGYDPIEGKE